VCTGVFGKRDIGRIEREFLDVLDFELSISENDIMGQHDTIISLVHPPRPHSHYIPPVPELDYSSSSPTSTSASLSPRTPSTFEESGVEPHRKSGQALPHQAQLKSYAVAPAQLHVSQPHREKRSHSSSTFRILRSLPLPRPFGHSSSSSSASRSEAQAPSQGVTQQGRCQLLAPFAAQPPSQVYV